ncbi:hypothetical protein [Rouxiella badensis]|uniref:hypothetical protein n=1 Tax=Rouxiella badensis TaxID=1646377 RepID=UPI003C69E832
MKYDVYKSNVKPTKLLFVPHGTDVIGTNLVLKHTDFAKLTLLHRDIPDYPTIIGVNPKKLKEGVAKDGYYITEIRVSITIQEKK